VSGTGSLPLAVPVSQPLALALAVSDLRLHWQRPPSPTASASHGGTGGRHHHRALAGLGLGLRVTDVGALGPASAIDGHGETQFQVEDPTTSGRTGTVHGITTTPRDGYAYFKLGSLLQGIVTLHTALALVPPRPDSDLQEHASDAQAPRSISVPKDALIALLQRDPRYRLGVAVCCCYCRSPGLLEVVPTGCTLLRGTKTCKGSGDVTPDARPWRIDICWSGRQCSKVAPVALPHYMIKCTVFNRNPISQVDVPARDQRHIRI